MAEALKILGRVVPSVAGSAVPLYTVPSATQTVVSSVIIANTTTSSTTYRLYAVTAGTSATSSNVLFYDVAVQGSASVVLQVGITLAAGDRLFASSATANVLTFTAFGQEIS